ncbi:hypothetical protein Pan216_21780 [Planctomycetes bacterium Pan216]|uniref:Uncharacterized protein n=1 Tax=Kolteria novifilia TaxID=2527975 RepID=A0A518B2V2_9BACT|nr:hypothetical protein Pan216_21780 [Planctomycetes bacterium Pan216]
MGSWSEADRVLALRVEGPEGMMMDQGPRDEPRRKAMCVKDKPDASRKAIVFVCQKCGVKRKNKKGMCKPKKVK